MDRIIDTIRTCTPWAPSRIALTALFVALCAPFLTVHGDNDFWSLREPVRPELPAVRDPNWIRTPIDAFILARLEQSDLRPSPPLTHPGRLLRRLKIDLTGLPPTRHETELFVADVQHMGLDEAYEKLVERLLASPEYGERWAQHWLDVVRYADSDGFEYDDPRPNAWRYRDWVINSLNFDKPYSRFVQEQIAGDELAPNDPNVQVATGLHRLGPLRLNGGMQDLEKNRQELLTEMTDAVGTAFLALTVGCAKCHDHRFDPIPQEDYYRLQAFFAATEPKDISLVSDTTKADYEKVLNEWKEEQKKVEDALGVIEKPYRERLASEKKAKLSPIARRAVETPDEMRTEDQKRIAAEASFSLNVSRDEVLAVFSGDDRSRYEELVQSMRSVAGYRPQPPAGVMAVADKGPDAPPTFVLRRGVPGRHAGEVHPVFPTAVSFSGQPSPPLATRVEKRDQPPRTTGDKQDNAVDAKSDQPTGTTGRRTALAEWLTAPNHPLTARVMVNRIWQHHFGRGIVKTPNDFGLMGDFPTHPELLDWLAREFVAANWSVKSIHRVLVNSATYRQQGRVSTEFSHVANAAANQLSGSEIDPNNKFLWSMRRRRLEAEALRDNILTVSGELNARRGGFGTRIPLPGMGKLVYKGFWYPDKDPGEHGRRSVYLFVKRNLRPPLFTNFDSPDTITSCGERTESTHSGQALTLLNSEFVEKSATAFARKLLHEVTLEAGTTRHSHLVTRAYQHALAREPSSEERATGVAFLEDQIRLVQAEKSSSELGNLTPRESTGRQEWLLGALSDYCLVIFNLNEFLFIE